MPKTILQMVNAVQAELGLPQSTSLFTSGSTDASGTQMLALANRTLDEMRQMHQTGWTSLDFEFNLVVDVAITTTGNMAAGSAIITNIPSTAALSANNFMINGAGISVAARLLSVDSATQVTMTMANTNTDALVGTEIQFGRDTYPGPTDIEFYQNRTFWDRTNRWELLGPDSPQIDQWHRSGIVATGPRRHFRRIGPYASDYRIWPPPFEISEPLQIAFEYSSIYAVAVAGSSTNFAQYFTGDTDTCLLNENALEMGIKWMFWEIKGFGSYVTLQNRWVDYVNRLIARDGANETLSMIKSQAPLLLSPANISDGYWPGTPSSS